MTWASILANSPLQLGAVLGAHLQLEPQAGASLREVRGRVDIRAVTFSAPDPDEVEVTRCWLRNSELLCRVKNHLRTAFDQV